jgi:high mobility group protein B1
MAHADKKRYDAERKAYKGPWKVPSISALAACKDPTAPKRPMSAFLAFSGEKRKAVRDQHRHLTNADVTRLLGRMWNELPVVERRVYLDEEARLRKAYKVALADWKKNKQIHMLAKQEEDDDKKKKLDGSSDSKVKAKQQLMSKSSVNSAGVLMKIEPKADPCIPHCAHNQPMSGFETRMAEATFGETQSPSFGTRLGRKSDTLMSKESPASISTSVGHNPSKQSWNDWHWQESRQDISTDDRMTIPPIDGPSYFPYHSTVVYVDRRPYSMIPEEREGIRSVHSARTYPTSYNSTVDLPYSYAPPYQRKSGNVATDGYLQNRSVYSERWHCSDRPVSANYYSDMGSHGMRDEFYLGSNHAYDSRMM